MILEKVFDEAIITKEMFEKYENCRRVGLTNMFDVKTVGILTGLEKNEIITIMGNYKELKNMFEIEGDKVK